MSRCVFYTAGFGGAERDPDSKLHGQQLRLQQQQVNNCRESEDSSSNVSDIKMDTGSSLSNYRYKSDSAGPDSMTAAAAVEDQLRTTANTPRGGSQTTVARGGIPLAGPVAIDPRVYATAGQLAQQRNRPLSCNGGTAMADYVDPINYVRYSTTPVSSAVSFRFPTTGST